MITFNEDISLIGVSESKKPIIMFMDHEEYKNMQEIIDEIEDIILYDMANKREDRAKEIVNIEEIENKVCV